MLARFIRTIWTLKRTDAGDNKKHNQSWAITISVLVSAMLCVWAVNYNRKVPFLTFVNMYSCTDGCVLFVFFFLSFFFFFFFSPFPTVSLLSLLQLVCEIYSLFILLFDSYCKLLCAKLENYKCVCWVNGGYHLMYVWDISISISIYVDISL